MCKYRSAFYAQRSGAKRRGIGWELTFDQWLTWWGEDIHRRGNGHGDLQMQRIADAGPYALDNIRKGYPRDNGKTRARVWQNRRTELRRREHQQFLDALCAAASNEPKDDRPGLEIAEAMAASVIHKHSFVIDKDR